MPTEMSVKGFFVKGSVRNFSGKDNSLFFWPMKVEYACLPLCLYRRKKGKKERRKRE